ncbi:acyltransferase family protein [Rhodococcus sp. BP-349]|nr:MULTISPECIES: lysophospholipid acyltransferase family protein [unclassified Rhodococcus (in: high G+C Gram-positive bacteria)]MBY6539667.1 acyltransferase family protein [Rhodococcus sp. BP-363]MBY6544005.1 acyltransferase family protein [Rhodococcus sp. BP-369]MBY6563235.1 acyltransferase family protein [Rhodococcus sp. BP-370]MBY6577527.1 acyltransferase family protein [Rhodococcus sp. BP-364]MBY6586828.1 acyltransferase family protein [Rhodococcus sp. BP-358]
MTDVAKVIPLHGKSFDRLRQSTTDGGPRAGSDPADVRGRHPSSYASPSPSPSMVPSVETPTPLVVPDTSTPDSTPDVGEFPSAVESVRRALVDRVAGGADFLRTRLSGDYEVDEFGYDPHFADSVWLPALRPLFEKWFRVEVRGIENVPAEGGALVVSNHAGVIPIDGLMASVAMRDHHPQHRALRMLAADLAFETPLVGTIARRAGHTLACQPDAERLLRGGEVVAVFPEGFKGIGKPFSERYKLQRFGRGGFVSAALRTQTPIIPCSIVGSEEIYPKIGDLTTLARVLGMPYFPVTPLFPHFGPLGLVPLPSKWYIEFGEPIETTSYEPSAADDPMELFEVTDRVRETIQQTLYRLLTRRRNVFLG